VSRTALITGASRGIGLATAIELAGRGYRVFGTSRKPRERREGEPAIDWLEMDVCDDTSVRAAFDALHARTEVIDALVCSAGYGIFGAVEEVSLEAAHAQLETNYFGTLRVVQRALPAMRERASGRIVLVGSLAGRAPNPFQSHYSSSKAAVDALVLALYNEVRGLGLHVSLVEPGDINTPFNEAMDWDDTGDASQRGSSPYAAALESCEQVVREALPKAPGPEIVARTIAKALGARRPRVRYTVGPDSWLVPIGRRLLPDRLSLRLIRDHFRLG